jgi:short subunit dehydrogenase-like uncharacterized protein
MSASRPVVVYGASGYTGRLACEFLRELGIPFTALGRDEGRVKAAMQQVPGIETADYACAHAAHAVDTLAEVFSGHEVVINTVGPFVSYGAVAVEAALQAGCHYLDSTGEQSWVQECREKHGAAFAAKGLLLAPSTAYMHATLDIAARYCLEHEGIDTLYALCNAVGVPTYGSIQTVVRVAGAKEFYLQDGRPAEWPRATGYEVTAPLWHHSILATPWGGTAMPVWYLGHPTVQNMKVLCGFAEQRQLVQQVIDLCKLYDAKLKDLPPEQQEATLTQIGESIQAGMPPRERRATSRNVDSVIGSGIGKRVGYHLYTTAAYQQTGLLLAWGSKVALAGGQRGAGFQAPCAAFGHRELHALLQRYGLAGEIERF